jgi:hypothetical protein
MARPYRVHGAAVRHCCFGRIATAILLPLPFRDLQLNLVPLLELAGQTAMISNAFGWSCWEKLTFDRGPSIIDPVQRVPR